ncbi:MAG TPA: acetylxylan esterase [Thermomicrobiales bacterium]|nr:acetylxylan esterase [Thermomicrobiales bacterium]
MPQQRGRADQHQTSVVRPPDFDAFWADVQAELDATPLDPTLEPVPMRSTPEVEVFEIGYTSLDGVRIAGWYCRPRESYIAGPYPGLSIVPGYVSEPTLPKSWAKLGYAAIGVAPRGKLRSNRQFNPGYPGLLIHNIVDRNTYSYRAFYADAARAIDFLVARPEVIADRIGVHGSSQGGALTLTTAAMRPQNVTCGAAGAPYLTGFMDAAHLTHSYPYEEMNEYLRLHPEREAAMRETVVYFDCINFAPSIEAPMLVYAGENDDVCPPETAHALVAAMPGEVTLHVHPRCGHDAGAYWEMPVVEAFLAQHLQPNTPQANLRAQTTVG